MAPTMGIAVATQDSTQSQHFDDIPSISSDIFFTSIRPSSYSLNNKKEHLQHGHSRASMRFSVGRQPDTIVSHTIFQC